MNCKIPNNGIKSICVLTPEQISKLIYPESLTRKVLVEKYKPEWFVKFSYETEQDILNKFLESQ